MQLEQEKELRQIIILKIPANKATARAPLGPTLGQYSIPIADFCNKFNTLTEEYKQGIIIKATIILYNDQTYDLTIQDPDVGYYIKIAANIEKGVGYAGKKKVKNMPMISAYMMHEIAHMKYNSGLQEKYQKYESYYKTLMGTLMSMGVIYIPDYNYIDTL